MGASGSRAAAALLLLLIVSCGDGDPILFPAPSELRVEAGVAFEGTVGTPVEAPPVVRVLDGRGNAAPGVEVRFRIEEGSGSVSLGMVVTDALGRANPGEWVLGTVVGLNVLVAEAAALGTFRFEVQAAPGAPARMEAASPLRREGDTGSTVPEPPAVLVVDRFDNPVPGVMVDFLVDSGSGSVDRSLALTGENGIASAQSWTLGSEAGTHRVRAVARHLGELGEIVFEADALLALAFTIEVVHLNQGSQTLYGDIGGVAGRPGLLRVVVRANHTNLQAPDVLVRLYQGGVLLREALLPAATGSVPVHPDLNEITDSWNLALDASDVVAGLSVVAVVDPDSAIPLATREHARFPREGTASLEVAPLPTFNITFFPIAATTHSTLGSIREDNMDVFLEGTRQWIPSATTATIIREPLITDSDLSTHDGWSQLIQDLQALRTAEGATDEYYHGIIGDFQGIEYGGFGYRTSSPGSRSRTALSYDRHPFATGAIAHELGHNLGRRHAPCGNPEDGIDAGFPYPDGGIGPPGYDILGGELRHPDTHRDFMSYCRPRWTSDYTYRAILEWRRQDPLAQEATMLALAAAAPPGGGSAPSPRQGDETTGLLIWGSLTAAGASLNPAFALTARPLLPESGGPHVIRGIAADGGELFRFSFTGVPVSESPDPSERHFSYFVPLDPSRIDALRRIELSGPAGEVERVARDVSPADRPALDEPQALLESDVQGMSRLRWDADRYPMVLVRDSESGRILSFGRSGELRLPDAAAVRGRLEVLVSDGVQSVSARIH